MTGAIAYVAVIGMIFFAGTLYAKNNIIRNMQKENIPEEAINKVVKIWR